VLAEAQDSEEIIQRIAAVDVGKAELMCCVGIPGERGKRLQEVRPYPTMTRSLLGMADHLRALGGDAGGDGSDVGLLEADLLRAGSAGLPDVAGQRQGRQAPALPPEDRPAGCGVVVQGRRAADDPPQFRSATRNPQAAGRDPVSDRSMLARIDAINTDIADLETRIEERCLPFAQIITRLDEIPGIGPIAAAVIIAEIGQDMTRFPTPGHLATWARFAPGVKESVGKKKGNADTGHNNRYLARIFGEAAAGAARTHTFLGERYRRIARRRGAKKAIVAVGRSILVVVWYLLFDPDSRFHDLGPDFYDRRVTDDRKNATTSASSKPSATPSPSPQPPDQQTPPASPRQSRSAAARSGHHDFETSDRYEPGRSRRRNETRRWRPVPGRGPIPDC
jgi:hypothetical protein